MRAVAGAADRMTIAAIARHQSLAALEIGLLPQSHGSPKRGDEANKAARRHAASRVATGFRPVSSFHALVNAMTSRNCSMNSRSEK